MTSVARFMTLSSGFKIPILGLGTYQSTGEKVCQAVDCALCVGYKHIDTAHLYHNEKDIGDVLKSRIQEGKASRKDIFLTSKIPPVYLEPRALHHCALEILDNLQTKYVDMLLLHSPWGRRNLGDGNLKPVDSKGKALLEDHNLIDAWRTMESLVKEGIVRSIGLSNFSLRLINRIWDKCEIKPSNLQSECHAYHQQNTLREYCSQKGIVFAAYSPLGIPSGHPSQEQMPPTPLLEHPVIKQTAMEMKKTPAQILLRFLLQFNVVLLPKSENTQRIEENFKIFDFDLSKQTMDSIKKLNCNMKFYTFIWAKPHPEYIEGECY